MHMPAGTASSPDYHPLVLPVLGSISEIGVSANIRYIDAGLVSPMARFVSEVAS